LDVPNGAKNDEGLALRRRANIFLPNLSYISPRNRSGIRHHLFDLYSNVFDGQVVTVLPVDNVHNLLLKAALNYSKIVSGSLNVVTQGYSVLSSYAAMLTMPDIHIIVHTWKVPGHTDGRLTSKIYDYFLSQIIKKSVLTVVASKKQEREIRALFPHVRILFAPVTVDSTFWTPECDQPDVLEKYNLEKDRFILTVGGNDRYEEISLGVAEWLGVQYIRVTRNKSIVNLVRETERKMGLSGKTIILNNISDTELISLYRNALIVLLPTKTKTNPAGLSSLVEAMACGGIIATHRDLAEGYIVDNVNGLLLNDYDINNVAKRLENIGGKTRLLVKANARKFAVKSLNSELVAANFKAVLRGMDLL